MGHNLAIYLENSGKCEINTKEERWKDKRSLMFFLSHGYSIDIIMRTHIHLTKFILRSLREDSKSYSFSIDSFRNVIISLERKLKKKKNRSNKNNLPDVKPYSLSCDHISLILLFSWAILDCGKSERMFWKQKMEKGISKWSTKKDLQEVSVQWW